MGAVPPHWRLWRHHPAAAPTDGSGGIIPPPLPLTAPAAVAVVKADTSSRGAKGLGPQSPSYQTPPPAHLKAEWAAQLHRRQGSRPRSGAQSAPLTPVLGAAILPVGGQGGFRFGQVRCSVTAGAVATAGSGAAVATAGSGGAVAPAGSIWRRRGHRRIWRRRGHRWIWRRRSPCWIWRRRGHRWIRRRCWS